MKHSNLNNLNRFSILEDNSILKEMRFDAHYQHLHGCNSLRPISMAAPVQYAGSASVLLLTYLAESGNGCEVTTPQFLCQSGPYYIRLVKAGRCLSFSSMAVPDFMLPYIKLIQKSCTLSHTCIHDHMHNPAAA